MEKRCHRCQKVMPSLCRHRMCYRCEKICRLTGKWPPVRNDQRRPNANVMSMEELNAMEEEQRRCLPHWWDKDTRLMRKRQLTGLALALGHF